MLLLIGAALLLMVCGSTVLQPALDPRERPVWFILFWFACAWLTVTAILLAFLDLLMLRTAARKAQRDLREEMKRETSRGSDAD